MEFRLTDTEAEKLSKFIKEVDEEVIKHQLRELTFEEQTDSVTKLFQESCKRHIEATGKPYAGASGGSLTYMFTPTSLGLITKVEYFGKEKTLTDFDDW